MQKPQSATAVAAAAAEQTGVKDIADVDVAAAGASTSREMPAVSHPSSSASRSRPPRRHHHQQQQQQQHPRLLLMRRWLQRLADDGDIPGVEWLDGGRRTLLRIPWCHGSRSEWNEQHSALFRAWAAYKGQ